MNRTFNLRILTTSDIHGSILPINYGDNTMSQNGMTKIASAIAKFRTENTILIDVGDAIQGSPLMYFHKNNFAKYENPVAKVFNHLKYDYFILGNHDFNYGQEYLKNFLDMLQAKKISGNILNENKETAFGKSYDIIKYENGPKVCVIGMTTDYIPHWENPKNIQGLTFENAFTTTKKIVEEVRTKKLADIIILAYHGGFERDLETGKLTVKDTGENIGSKIVSEITGIDAFLTGHQHRAIATKKNNISIVQPGGNATYLGMIDLNLVREETGWKVKSQDQKLLLASDFESDKNMELLVADIETANQKFLDETIGYVEYDNLKITDQFKARLEKHPVVTFINKVQLEASGADISSTSLANNVTGFTKEISIRNVLSTYVYPNTLSVLKITGDSLKKYLERNAEYFAIENNEIISSPRFSYPKQEHYNYDMLDGISYTIKVSNPIGKRVIKIEFKGKPISDNDVFSIVMNNYRATGGGDFEMISDLPIIKEIPLDIAELIIEHIRSVKKIVVEDIKNIKIIK